jgi:hypothetical protein
MIKFALVVDQKVMHIFSYNEETPIGEKWIAAMRSNVLLKRIDGYLFNSGDILENNIIYRKNNSGSLEELPFIENMDQNRVGYAGIIDNEIIGGIIINKTIFGEERFLQFDNFINSNHTIVEATSDVEVGWVYNGINFAKE